MLRCVFHAVPRNRQVPHEKYIFNVSVCSENLCSAADDDDDDDDCCGIELFVFYLNLNNSKRWEYSGVCPADKPGGTECIRFLKLLNKNIYKCVWHV